MSELRRVGDWVEYVDPASGKKYYANVITKETRWTCPVEIPLSTEAKSEVTAKACPTTATEEMKNGTSNEVCSEQVKLGERVELGDRPVGVFATDRASTIALLRKYGIELDECVDDAGTLMIGPLKYKVGTGSPTDSGSDTLCFKNANGQNGAFVIWQRDVRVDLSKWRKEEDHKCKFFGFSSLVMIAVGVYQYVDIPQENVSDCRSWCGLAHCLRLLLSEAPAESAAQGGHNPRKSAEHRNGAYGLSI